jgi:hypothetical protein
MRIMRKINYENAKTIHYASAKLMPAWAEVNAILDRKGLPEALWGDISRAWYSHDIRDAAKLAEYIMGMRGEDETGA